MVRAKRTKRALRSEHGMSCAGCAVDPCLPRDKATKGVSTLLFLAFDTINI